jgi:hypothetical protein
VFFHYPLAISLNRRKFSMCPSKFEMRYMGYNITMTLLPCHHYTSLPVLIRTNALPAKTVGLRHVARLT